MVTLSKEQEQKQQKQKPKPKSEEQKEWIRGVNIGGWLMAERFITPYLFAINTCHLEGSLCWYPGQIGAPNSTDTDNNDLFCDTTSKYSIGNHKGVGIDKHGMDYPVDEYTLGQVLRSHSIHGIQTATKYMERHWDTFLTYDDLQTLQKNGVTHLRIPMGYWIRLTEEDNNDSNLKIEDDEPFIPGGWKYFVRACKWARELNLIVWADLHGAPGSENGFDNSGHYLGKSSCSGWSSSSTNVQRTLDIITDLALAIKKDKINDVVTGFGILNEPFSDCNETVLKQYYNDALTNIRSILGSNTSIFIGDTFRPDRFNDGSYWIDNEKHHNTYLDSHPYHVFFEQGRSFTPKQHIAYVCRHDAASVKECCYEDDEKKTIPSHGISRLIGEWSGAFDSLPTALTPNLMKGISLDGQVPLLNRTLDKKRSNFLRNFVQAQMIAYEAADSITKDSPNGIASGWLFWNFKMEGGAFIEWDFLRGLKEGWIPPIPAPNISSESLYGSCLDVYNRTDDDYSIIDEYPNPRTLDWNQWQGWDANDDFVMSDPSAIRPDVEYRHNIPLRQWYDIRRITTDQGWFIPLLIGMIVFFILNKLGLRSYIVNKKKRENSGYTELEKV
ncbi:exo-1,3-beta-glucanase [Fragilariopsis cylindrus CCMP1102]|uniref:glucan 1,3-beta-glucosidase n=1 Tax=Fragilariopsis cylindrus CCMP1102 TaxID=635003 RepID=A0A1E7FMT5_9STRA|nr:exo-1,3-beta-glucanase [Fragilariopsis cylindrus CCMP1102]|eukprot:OEU19488.1 exo-1,3-beta-glucanase [Fragilariopsis cylindrus CCMP1102]